MCRGGNLVQNCLYSGGPIEQSSTVTVLKTAVTFTVTTPTQRDSSALNGGTITAITIPVVVVVASLLLLLFVVVVGTVLKRKSMAEEFAR